MPTTVRSSARRRRKNPDEKLPERPGESSAQVMAPTRMKLRVRRRDNATGGAGAAGGGGQPVEEEERSREGGGSSGGRSSSRRKNSNNTVTAAAATSSSSPPPSSSPPTSSSSTAARAVMAAEEASPDSKCPICLDRFNNLAYLDRCLHRFCFPCIQEWSHNKAECPLCKQPFASILHSVRAEDDFKEYTLRPAPANSNVAATVAMVAAMASAARSDHQMRLMLRRHRGADGVETSTRRQRRERGGRGRGGGRAGERTGVWEWYLDSPPLGLPPLPHQPAVAEDSEDGEDLEEQRVRGGADLAERGVIFEGLTGLGGAGASMAPNDRASRRLMTRLAARQRLQREGGTVRRLRERETVAFRRALYRSSTRVRGVAGVGNQGQQQRDITAESFRRNPVHLNRLRPWLRRELTVLYGAHGSLVDIVQRIIMARLARHGLEDTPTIEDELRPFLLARTDHFLHELVSFARSPLSLENYDLQAVYEPPATALELDGTSSSTDSSSVIAISEGEDEEQQVGGRSEERPLARVGGTYDDLIQTGSSLSLSAWDDETPGPSYSSAEPSCSLGPLSFSPAPQEAANEEGGEKQEDEEGEEECLIVGYKKPIAERTPELVQLSSDTEEDKKEEEEEKAKFPPISTATPPLSYLPIIPPSTSAAYRHEQDDEPKEKDSEAGRRRSRVRSSSGSSGKSRKSVCTLSPSTPGDAEQQQRETGCWRDRKQSAGEAGREKRRRKRSRRGRERSGDRLRKSGTLYNPNRSIYPAMMRQRSHSPSPFHSSVESAGSPLPPSPADSSWEYHCSQGSPLTSSISSPSSSSPLGSSPQPSSQTPPMPSLSPREHSNAHHGEKPGGKRKYKSRHLDSNDKDPTWRPSSSHWREKRRERREKEKRRMGRDDRRRRERQRRDSHQDSGGDSSRRSREDRSPSVEIIYEGTIISNATQPPARKRRRKRHRMTQHSSSPVIITLDSDSSHKNNSSGSSTPLSSQQTVDFSDLPPLTLVHSAGVGRVLNAEIGELPVDILDRGSDGSEMESVGRSESAGPIAIDNSDNSDHDVDVENVEEGGSLLRLVEDKGPTREAVVGGSQPTGESDAAPKTKRDSEVLTSDSRLLATILNDLKGIGAQKRGLSLNFGSNCSSDTGNKHFRGQCEVSQGHSNQSDNDWSAETRHPDQRRQSNESRDQNQGFVLPTFRTSAAPLPPLEWLKDCRVREEAKDVPPLLKQASPVRLYTRNTPPPLKHKDAGSPHLLPVSPIDLRSPHTFDTDVNSHVDLNSNSNGRPVDSCANDSQAMNALDLKEEPASTSRKSATDMRSSCRAATIGSDSAKEGAFDVHSTSRRPPIDSHSSCSGPEYSSNADRDFSSSHSSELHSSCDGSKEVSPRPSSSPADLHHVNSLSTLDVHSAKNKPAHTDSTSRGCRTLSPNSCRASPIDLDPSSSVSTEDTPAGSDVFSGANCNDTSPPVCGAFNDSRTQNSSSSIDSHSSGKIESERFSPSRVCSEPTTAPCSRLLPADIHPRSLKSTVGLDSSTATSEGNKPLSLTNHEDRLPPIDLHHPSLVPPANKPSSTFPIDEHLNHTAFSSSTSQTSHRKCSSWTESPDESHSKLLHPTDSNPPSSNTQFPIDTRSKHNSPIDSRCDSPIDSLGDFKLPTDNHITSSPQSAAAAGNQWDSSSSLDAHPESHSAIDEHSASITWSTQTHSSTYDT